MFDNFQMDFTKSKTCCSFENWVSRNKVRVPNIQATNVLKCSNEPELKADLRSVKISELAQKLTEIATFSCQFGLNLWKFEKKIGYLCQIDRSFDRRGGKNRFQREIGANGSPILPTFCQYNKVKPRDTGKKRRNWKTWVISSKSKSNSTNFLPR